MKQTQGERLVQFIDWHHTVHGRWPTYGDLELSRISTCPWQRLREPGHKRALRAGERLERSTDSAGRVVFKIARG